MICCLKPVPCMFTPSPIYESEWIARVPVPAADRGGMAATDRSEKPVGRSEAALAERVSFLALFISMKAQRSSSGDWRMLVVGSETVVFTAVIPPAWPSCSGFKRARRRAGS